MSFQQDPDNATNSDDTKDKMSDEQHLAMQQWAQQLDEEFSRPTEEQNFVELTRLPKKIDVNALRSLVVTASRVRPVSVEICFKEESQLEQVALVEFKSQQEAYMAVERLRSSAFTKSWQTKVMMNPKFVDSDNELFKKWLS